ncbi:Cobyrinate a,c-diamide synthase [Trichinella spiralis]|uniref:Cobyrinate a,c-diamide synthase n=1 Tax=Trichinella spiralis TaxID=6334 RepID=A0ABR3KV71_TRISP
MNLLSELLKAAASCSFVRLSLNNATVFCHRLTTTKHKVLLNNALGHYCLDQLSRSSASTDAIYQNIA